MSDLHLEEVEETEKAYLTGKLTDWEFRYKMRSLNFTDDEITDRIITAKGEGSSSDGTIIDISTTPATIHKTDWKTSKDLSRSSTQFVQGAEEGSSEEGSSSLGSSS